MDEKKKLKKLVLKKEEIVNLNDYQMGQAKGGTGASSKFCTDVSKWVSGYLLSKVVDYTVDKVSGYMGETSIYNCPPDPQISKEFYTGGCLLPEVVVRP